MNAIDSPLRFLPVGIDVRGRACLVVGGGAVGTRKATTLARAGARVAVVAPSITGELRALIASGSVCWTEGPYQREHLNGAFLAIAATDDPLLNATVAADAIAAGALVCDASSAGRSQVIFGALLQRDGATIAVFTDGEDPAGARQLRDRVARCVEREEHVRQDA